MSNANLGSARSAKNDEFYTQTSDIEKELKHYKNHFKGKTVFLNCDDPYESNFWLYFKANFSFLGLKKLIATHYDPGKTTYKIEMTAPGIGTKTSLKQNGNFRSDEAIELLKEADIIVTNPPFSLFREFIDQLMLHNKKFIIIGSMNAITYKNVFPLIQGNKLWLGNYSVHNFMQPDGTIKKFGNICWYTNLDFPKRYEDVILYKPYSNIDHPKYDNFDVINVNKVTDIPIDYFDIMGVPISFLAKHNPNQFEIVGIANPNRWVGHKCLTIVKGKSTYQRLLIKRK